MGIGWGIVGGIGRGISNAAETIPEAQQRAQQVQRQTILDAIARANAGATVDANGNVTVDYTKTPAYQQKMADQKAQSESDAAESAEELSKVNAWNAAHGGKMTPADVAMAASDYKDWVKSTLDTNKDVTVKQTPDYAQTPTGRTAHIADETTIKQTPDYAQTPAGMAAQVQQERKIKGIPTYADLNPQNRFTFTPGVDPISKLPTVYAGNTKTGQITSTGVQRPTAGGGAGSAETVKKAEQFGLGLNSLGEVIDNTEKRNFRSPNLLTGPLAAESRGRGVMGELAQGGLNMTDPGLSDLSGASNLFMSAAAHSVGGARITPEQIAMFGSGYAQRTGDSPALVKRKLERSADFLNAAAAVLPPDMVAKQHASIPPLLMAKLRKYGYGRAPSAEALAAVQQLQGPDAGGAMPATTNPFASLIPKK